MPYEVIRSHEICAGHRVVGHESKCRHLHGHNYVFHFHVAPKPLDGVSVKGDPLDQVGRVIDFSVVKTTLCNWPEENWDHKFLHWEQDPVIEVLKRETWETDKFESQQDQRDFHTSLVSLPFNPTAENLAAYMVEVIGPLLLNDNGVELVKCTIEETSKCHVGYTK